MPELRKKSWSAGDQSWLGSTHGIRNCRTAVLDVSTFTAATHYPNGYFPSGLIVNCANEGAVLPWTAALGEVFGVLFTEQPTDGIEDLNVPVLRHGTVKTTRLPVSTGLPTTAPNGFVFITGSGS